MRLRSRLRHLGADSQGGSGLVRSVAAGVVKANIDNTDIDSDNAWHRLAAGTEEVLPQVLRSCRVSLGPIAGEGAEGFDGDGAPRTGDNNACDRDAVRDALGLTRCVGKRRGMRIESHWLGTGSPGGIRQDLGGGNLAFFSPGWPRC